MSLELRRENACEDLKQGCLAGAVRANDPEDLACLDVEGDIRENRLLSILLVDRIHPKQNLIVCLSGGARSFHRERCIASDWGAWRDQLENSVHAQFPRHNEYCAELGRRPSDGVSALPRPKGYSLIYSTTRTETHHETRSQSPRSFGGTADFMRIRVEDKPFALRPPTGDIGPQEFTLTRGVHHRIRSTDKNA